MTATRLTGADCVIEQGTSGIWTWRKWQSGIAECWGTYTASIAVNVSSGSYGGYRSNGNSASLPSGLFAAAPCVTASVSVNGQGAWVSNVQGGTASQCSFYLGCGASLAAANRGVSIHAFGRWK